MSGSKIGVDCCGDRYASDCTHACDCGCSLCYCVSCYQAHRATLPAPSKAHAHVIDLVKSLSAGRCGCQYNMGSCTLPTYDLTTGELRPGHYDQGPRTLHCLRCRAREALEADGIPYAKDDRVFYTMH